MRFPWLTFRVKVTLSLCSVVLLLGAIAVTHARQDMRRILGSELEARGQAIATSLAANGADLLLTGDLVGLYDLVNRTKMSHSDVRYILILDSDRRVRGNTFGGGMPVGLLEANILPPGTEVQLRRIKTEEGLVRDVAAGILGGKLGLVRVGMSDVGIERAVEENSRELMILVAVAVAVGMVFSYGLSYLLTRPLGQLLEAVRSVAGGDLSRRIASPSADEVGQLGMAFNTMTQELERKERTRQQLMERVISSQENERRRVARDLHDELAQQLTSVLLDLEAVEGALPATEPGAKRTVQMARKAAESSLVETRKLIAGLRPTVLDDLGLVPAIRSCAEDYLSAVGAEVTITATSVPDSLPPVVETAVFRIVQEAVSNSAKHSAAKRVHISLSAGNGAVRGEIADDGRGFEQETLSTAPAHIRRDFGLQGMEERALVLGGTLTVKSSIGQGTRITFVIPLPESDGHE